MQSMGGAAGGHLYIQTNETKNAIVHYVRSPDGTITEAERAATGGSGSGTFKPISGQESAPNAFEGARSVILAPDRRFLFTTNGGDNSVSNFAVGQDGKLTLIDVKRTGNTVAGRSGTAKSLAYAPSSGILYVLHAFGPDHVRLMTVDAEGQLTARRECYTANTPDKPDRVATMIVLSPDERFVLVGTTFDQPAQANPDGSPILWVRGMDGSAKSIASNAPDPDGLVVFTVGAHGTLSEPSFQDGGGGSPWFPLFLNRRPDHFVVGYAVADGVALAQIDEDGKVSTAPVAVLDTSGGKPSELCWLSISSDDRWVFATSFGYGYVTSYRLEGNVLSVAKDPACPKVPGDGTFRALNGTVSSGPSDNWISPDGAYFYQIYGNASKLVGYSIQADGSLEEITSTTIPYNSPQGLTGF
jgi:6-phosphogluconolactonase (cycloisomerase 2 family)